jgi:hypothetical protein
MWVSEHSGDVVHIGHSVCKPHSPSCVTAAILFRLSINMGLSSSLIPNNVSLFVLYWEFSNSAGTVSLAAMGNVLSKSQRETSDQRVKKRTI